jgi:hypothetical protein
MKFWTYICLWMPLYYNVYWWFNMLHVKLHHFARHRTLRLALHAVRGRYSANGVSTTGRTKRFLPTSDSLVNIYWKLPEIRPEYVKNEHSWVCKFREGRESRETEMTNETTMCSGERCPCWGESNGDQTNYSRLINKAQRVSVSYVHPIVHDHLTINKALTKWVPRMLTQGQKTLISKCIR